MQPSKQLVKAVRAGFVLKGTTLGGYCREHKIDDGNAHRALSGKWKGLKASELCSLLISASGVSIGSSNDESANFKCQPLRLVGSSQGAEK